MVRIMADRIKRKQIGPVTEDSSIVGETSGQDLTSGADTIHGQYDTPAKQLKVLNDAIFAILAGGQSYKIGSRSLTRADLSELIAERDKIEKKIADDAESPLFPGTFAADFGYDNRR